LNLGNSRLISWKEFEIVMDEKTKDGELKEVILWIIQKLTLKFWVIAS
jgi:hypothetical protein